MSIGKELLHDSPGPSTEKLERIVKRALRRLEGEPEDPLEAISETAALDAVDELTGALRRCGLLPSPPPTDGPHPLAPAGLKLKELRIQSGWTVEEIAERTRCSLDLLTAFENGDSDAAGKLTTFDLESLAAACCGNLDDLLGAEHPWAKAAHRRDSRPGPSIAIDPHG